MNRDKILPPRAVEGLIAQGSAIVVFEDFVLRLDGWLDKHPGGRLAIQHMVGKDATDEIMAYHRDATLKTMKAFRIGRKPMGPWINMTPPIRGGIYRLPSTPTLEPEDCCVDEAPSGGAAFLTLGEGIDVDGVDSPDAMPASVRRRVSPSRTAGKRLGSPAPSTATTDRNSGYDGAADGDSDGMASTVDKPEKPEAGLLRGGPGRMCPIAYTDLTLQQNIEQDLRDYPSLDPVTQQHIVSKYRQLHQQVRDEGLYECRYIEYGKEAVRCVSLFALFLTAMHYGWYMTSACFLGTFWHQIMFTAHDAGHRAITQNFVVDTLIAMFIGDFCCGLSIGWWKSSHNVHHLITNHPNHDPDIQNVPLFATCPSFFKSIHSSYYDFSFVWDAVADFMVPYQVYTYYPVMGVARFNLYLLSWLHVLSTKTSSLGNSKAWWIRPTEIAFMACYWFLFGYCLLWRTIPTWTLRVAFVLVCHMITMPLHVQFTLSHWGMSTAELGESESFAQRQLRTTMDVDCPAWLDFIHGGLQFQTVHHLFPRVPRHNLRRVQELGLQFSKDTGVPYSILKFTDGNRKVLDRLGEIGGQVRILVSCQKYMAATGESGLH